MESLTLHHNGPGDERSSGRTVRLPARPDAVATARATVARAAAAAPLAADRIDDLLIAVSEAVTNAVEAQARIGTTSPIEVLCSVEDSVFEVEVRDRGDGYDPGRVQRRPAVGDPRHLEVDRGWGIQLMRQLVDELVFDLTGPGTCVRLRVAVTD